MKAKVSGNSLVMCLIVALQVLSSDSLRDESSEGGKEEMT